MKLLLRKGLDITEQLIDNAAAHVTPEMLALLLKQYPKRHLKDTLLLNHAVWGDKLENVRVLLDTGLNVNGLPSKRSTRVSVPRDTALHAAAWDKKIEIMELLLKRGGRIDIPGAEGKTALEKARMYNQVKVEQMMLDMGGKGKKDEQSRGKFGGLWRCEDVK
jgi:ankyrin repeat protein